MKRKQTEQEAIHWIHWLAGLMQLKPCDKAYQWIMEHKSLPTPEHAWRQCRHTEWMWWAWEQYLHMTTDEYESYYVQGGMNSNLCEDGTPVLVASYVTIRDWQLTPTEFRMLFPEPPPFHLLMTNS